MSRTKDERPRVLGPYKHPKGWKITVVDPGANQGEGSRRDLYFGPDKKAEAEICKTDLETELSRQSETTFEEALEGYEEYLRTKGTKPVSYKETLRRLRVFFPQELPVSRLSKARCQELYDNFREGKSVDYHRNTLAEAKTFLRWTVAESLTSASPLEHIKGVGARKKGKPQLTGDEARRFYAAAFTRAQLGDEGAIGVLVALLMGMRNREIFMRQVRDLDLEGTVLRISQGKTAKAARSIGVPETLQSILARLAHGKEPTSYLFSQEDGRPHTKSWLRSSCKRLCREAKVPYVPPHGLRGTHASLAVEVGHISHSVANALGHESFTTTEQHYARQDAVAGATQGRALLVLSGGRK